MHTPDVEELAFEKDSRARSVLFYRAAHTEDRKVPAQVGEPVSERLAMYPHAELARCDRRLFIERVKAVVLRERLDDDAQGKALMLGHERRELFLAASAGEQLDSSVLVLAYSFFDDVAVAAIRAGERRFDLMHVMDRW